MTRASTPVRFRFRDEAIDWAISARGWVSSSFPTAAGSWRAASGAMSPAAMISAFRASKRCRKFCRADAFMGGILARRPGGYPAHVHPLPPAPTRSSKKTEKSEFGALNVKDSNLGWQGHPFWDWPAGHSHTRI